MSTHRYVATSFWDDAWIQELEPDAKLLYMYLLTNSLTNIAGVYKITVRRMTFDTGIDKSRLSEILHTFKAAGKASFVDEYMILPNWPKHQKINSKDTRLGIERVLSSLPEHVLIALKEIGYSYDSISDEPKDTTPQGDHGGAYRGPTGGLQGSPPTLPYLSDKPNLAEQPNAKPAPEPLRADISKLNPEELSAFKAYCHSEAKAAKADRPAAYAHKLMNTPDVLDAWRASLVPPPAPRNDACPEPGPCPKCGGAIKADRWDGSGRCLACGTWFKYDVIFESWDIDAEAAVANTG